MANLIEVKDLEIRRAGRVTLTVEQLSIARGETLALVGPNGAGKSTLLLALARLLKPARGEIYFDGKALHEWDELDYRRRISFVFQAPLLIDMTVEQNVALGLTFRRTARRETKARVRKWMEQLSIESLSRRRAGELSGGEAQRVSLARALVLDPELLLLDEPFAALDPPTHARMLDDLSTLLAAGERTAVFVTHDLQEAAQISDRVAVIVAGRLRQVGPAREIKSEPADAEVAKFLQSLPHEVS
jgi:tungstate transport system ATP-binding protein